MKPNYPALNKFHHHPVLFLHNLYLCMFFDATRAALNLAKILLLLQKQDIEKILRMVATS